MINEFEFSSHVISKGKRFMHTAWDWDWDRDQWVLIYYAEMFALVRNRDRYQDPLFPIVPVPFPGSYSVNKKAFL